jgi:hypothetical protein
LLPDKIICEGRAFTGEKNKDSDDSDEDNDSGYEETQGNRGSDTFKEDCHATDRTTPRKINIKLDQVQLTGESAEIRVDLRLVRFQKLSPEKVVENSCVGCILKCNNRKLLSFRFDKPLAYASRKDVDCKHVMCIPAQDGKMAATVSGQGACNVLYSCLRCVCPTEDFKYYQRCMHDEFPELVGNQEKYAPPTSLFEKGSTPTMFSSRVVANSLDRNKSILVHKH